MADVIIIVYKIASSIFTDNFLLPLVQVSYHVLLIVCAAF